MSNAPSPAPSIDSVDQMIADGLNITKIYTIPPDIEIIMSFQEGPGIADASCGDLFERLPAAGDPPLGRLVELARSAKECVDMGEAWDSALGQANDTLAQVPVGLGKGFPLYKSFLKKEQFEILCSDAETQPQEVAVIFRRTLCRQRGPSTTVLEALWTIKLSGQAEDLTVPQRDDNSNFSGQSDIDSSASLTDAEDTTQRTVSVAFHKRRRPSGGQEEDGTLPKKPCGASSSVCTAPLSLGTYEDSAISVQTEMAPGSDGR